MKDRGAIQKTEKILMTEARKEGEKYQQQKKTEKKKQTNKQIVELRS